MASLARLREPTGPCPDPIHTFQTVSPGHSVNRGRKQGRDAHLPRLDRVAAIMMAPRGSGGGRALGAVTPEDAKGWFAHCGYEAEAQR